MFDTMWTNKQLQSVLIIIAAIVLSIESEQSGFSEDFLAARAVLLLLIYYQYQAW